MSAADLVTSAPGRRPSGHSLTTRIVIYGLLLLVIVIRAPDGLEGLLQRRAGLGRRAAPGV